jgi:hypothetical protein
METNHPSGISPALVVNEDVLMERSCGLVEVLSGKKLQWAAYVRAVVGLSQTRETHLFPSFTSYLA